MKRWRWEIAAGPGDFLPLVVGFVLLALAVPSFLVLLIAPDPNSGGVRDLLLFIHAIGILLGFGFLVLGMQLLSTPGSLIYRLSHGRFFGR